MLSLHLTAGGLNFLPLFLHSLLSMFIHAVIAVINFFVLFQIELTVIRFEPESELDL